MKTFGKVWNECNEYGVPKITFMQCNQMLRGAPSLGF